MTRRIVITSGKGGVGKTTLTALLGRELAKRGRRTVVCDLDFGLNNLDMVLGAERLVTFDLADVVFGRCRLKQALVADESLPDLLLLPSRRAYASDGISGQRIKAAMEGLRPYADYLLLDSPAGLDIGFHRAVSSADEAIVVVTPSPLSVRDADKTLSLLHSYGMRQIFLVVNRVRGELLADGETLSPEEIARLLKTPLVGVIGEDEGLLLGKKGSRFTARSVALLAENLDKGKNRTADPSARYRGVLGSIRRRIKRSV